MKTQNTKLNFNKQSIVELDNKKLSTINGGCPSVSLTGCVCGWIIEKLNQD